MRALVRVAPGARTLEVRDLAVPTPAADEVVIRVTGCGICGTDVSLYNGALAYTTDGEGASPVVIGHEFTGMVAARGTSVTTLGEGDWVVVNPHLFCGRCAACLRGEEEICEDRPLLSWDRPGGAAEYVAVRASNAYRVEREIALDVGALAEPLAVAVHAVRRLALSVGERVVVVGSGTIGILASFVAADAGVEVMLVGLPADRTRLEAARRLGLETAVRGEAGPPAGSRNADASLEAAGTGAALLDAVALVRKGGRVGIVGLPHHPVAVDVADIVFAEKTLLGIRGYAPRDWTRVAELLSAHGDALRALVTHSFDLAEVEVAMDVAAGREAVKVVLRPAGGWYNATAAGDLARASADRRKGAGQDHE